MNLTANNATQSCATQGRAGIATNQITCHAAQYRTSSSVALGLSHIGTCTQRSGQHRTAHGDAGLVERAGERLVLPGGYFHLRQRLRDVVETPPCQCGRTGSSGAENRVAGMVGNGCAAFDCSGIVPDRHRRHCRDLALGYSLAVADSSVVEVVQINAYGVWQTISRDLCKIPQNPLNSHQDI